MSTPTIFIAQQTNVGPGEVLTLKLDAVNPVDGFRGFLIQAHNPTSQTFAPLGAFTNSPSNTKIVTCSPGFQVLYCCHSRNTTGGYL